jgi:hypothetical protein
MSFGYYYDYCVLCYEDFHLFLLFFCSSVSGVCLSLYVLFLLIGCAGSVGISLASRVMYILCVCFRCVECRAGTILIVHFGGVGGGTVRIFFSLWFCSGGYGTVGLVRGRWSVFSFRFLQFAVRSFGGWVSLVGNFLCYTFSVGSL